MRVLIIHEEARAAAGAERMLQYFLEGAKGSGFRFTVAAVRESKFGGMLPPDVPVIWVPEKKEFSLPALWGQWREILRAHRRERFEVLHGWAARDWELTALVRWRTGLPALGTLHDHPHAPFHSRVRQTIMRRSAALGLDRIACVSEAVRSACATTGYAKKKLVVVHNGLPPAELAPAIRPMNGGVFRIGFLGVFAERKGLRDFFEMLNELAGADVGAWEAVLAGGTQDAPGEELVRSIQTEHSGKPWWPRVAWKGWVEKPAEFLRSLDLLVVPSSEFDPFPTVLLEAGREGIPVLAARVGGIAEIVADGETGWLYEAGKPTQAARLAVEMIRDRSRARLAGERAARRVREEFSVGKMVARYGELYSTLASND